MGFGAWAARLFFAVFFFVVTASKNCLLLPEKSLGANQLALRPFKSARM
jgi:hypothetical protein